MFNSSLYTLIALSSIVLLTSCSKSPDVRLTLCQDLSQLLLPNANLQWQEHEAILKGYEDMEMKVHFTMADKKSAASCFYPYTQDDIGAETFQEPTSAYATYPSKMILNGRTVDSQLLATSVNKAMLVQGKRAVVKAKEEIQHAEQNIKAAGQDLINKIKE